MSIDIITLALMKAYADEQIRQAAIGSVDLTDYLKKEETYTRQEIDDKVENLDYESLKNKPFYSEIVTDTNRDIIPLQEIAMWGMEEEGMPEGMVMATLPLSNTSPVVPNVLYNFAFDDEIVQVKFVYFDGLFVAGNLGLAGMGEDTGEPYLIGLMYDEGELDAPMFAINYVATEGTHTVGLSYIGDAIPLIPEDTYNFELQYDEKENWYYYDTCWDEIFGLRPQDGEKYKFTFGDTVCEITPVYDDNYEAYLAGNLHIDDEEAEDTGENYLLLITENYITIKPLNEGEYTVSLEKVLQPTEIEIIHKIDSKYLDIDIDVPYTEDNEGNAIFEGDVLIDGGNTSIGTSIKEINEDIIGLQKDILELSFDPSQPSSVSINDLMSSATLEMTATTAKIIINFYSFAEAERIKNLILKKSGLAEIIFSDDINNTAYHINPSSISQINCQIIINSFSFVPGKSSFSIQENLTRNIQSIRLYSDNGDYSHSEGGSTVARGDYSHAEGCGTFAASEASHAEGYETVAGGLYSHAEGNNTIADGFYSHAEGNNTTAKGSASHAEGSNTTTNGDYSHAEGYQTTASKEASHAEGYQTTASGDYSHAEGNYTHANGYGSHAEGGGTSASSYCSHAEGNYARANGAYSHAEGSNTVASGEASHAEGYYTIANGQYSHVQGKYNIQDDENKYAHIVGNGEDSMARSNAHTLDWDGNAWYAGKVESTGVIIPSSTEGSTKKFLITVDDSGTLTATEVV